uniref:Uncharacterized protein n=1 Tax=Chryseobacterium endophyticum TaxID=1854762 RepID=A0AAU6WM68_9FLAO
MENNKLPTRQELKTYFETDKYPTQSQFANLIDAYWHKEDNIGTIDHTESTGNVYTKSQSNAKFIISDDFVNDNNKIIAEKIEALGLTTLIEGTETSISGFAANSSKYIFETNDFIAIPVNGGNYSLYMFKGGDKINVQNYLATGISNITMGMVEGLQDALNRKMDKPSGTGNYFIRQNGSINSFVKIEPSSYYLTLFNGNDFVASNAYYNNSKIGIGTQSPSEMLHLDNGRIRSKAIVLDNNAETFPNQLTTNGNKFYGTDSTGIKKEIMMKEDFKNELLSAPSLLTDTEKTAFKTAMNGDGQQIQ